MEANYNFMVSDYMSNIFIKKMKMKLSSKKVMMNESNFLVDIACKKAEKSDFAFISLEC